MGECVPLRSGPRVRERLIPRCRSLWLTEPPILRELTVGEQVDQHQAPDHAQGDFLPPQPNRQHRHLIEPQLALVVAHQIGFGTRDAVQVICRDAHHPPSSRARS
jgi:hypothetical protein